MPSETAKKAHAVFMGAIERQRSERIAYAHEACGQDAEALAEVLRLIEALDETATFLEAPVIESVTRRDAPAAPAPIEVPGYDITGVIGVGGMATVYEARQQHPRRTVAMKVMYRHLSETSARDRFLYETELLATLKHPGIAQIYEAGAVESDIGRSVPYFTMELVDHAKTITEHARTHDLSLSERLEMFAQVCEAVRYGHEAGIIHRDLKPSNILVGADGRTKIIDFGIARSFTSPDERLTQDADRDRLIGTLNYMSPEQCAGTGRVDTRSDVYALGVVLYELITDRLPQDLASRPLADAVRAKADPIARPSTHTPRARGDLDSVVMSALDPDPDQRYPTAGGLAEDLRRLLSDRPVQARPQTTLYQVRKFARRHRALVAGVAAAALILIGGIAATSSMALVAERARQAEAERAEELARVVEFQSDQLSGIDVSEVGARIATSFRRRLSEMGATDAERETLERVNFTSLALDAIDEAIIGRAPDDIREQFADQPALRASMLQTLASTANRLGLLGRCEPLLSEALEIRRAELGEEHPDTLTTLHSLGALFSLLGQYDRARVYLEDAHERRARLLGPDHADTLLSLNVLAGARRQAGDIAGALELWTDTLERRRRTLGENHAQTLQTLNNVGLAHAMLGDSAAAEEAWTELVDRSSPDDQWYLTALNNLALLKIDREAHDEARRMLEEVLGALRIKLGDDHPSTLNTMSSLASLLHEMDEIDAAGILFDRNLDGRERTLGRDHPDTLRSRANRAAFLADVGPPEGPIDTLFGVLDTQRATLARGHPHTLETTLQLSNVLIRAERLDEAERLANDVIDVGQHPRYSSVAQELLAEIARARTAEDAGPDE